VDIWEPHLASRKEAFASNITHFGCICYKWEIRLPTGQCFDCHKYSIFCQYCYLRNYVSQIGFFVTGWDLISEGFQIFDILVDGAQLRCQCPGCHKYSIFCQYCSSRNYISQIGVFVTGRDRISKVFQVFQILVDGAQLRLQNVNVRAVTNIPFSANTAPKRFMYH